MQDGRGVLCEPSNPSNKTFLRGFGGRHRRVALLHTPILTTPLVPAPTALPSGAVSFFPMFLHAINLIAPKAPELTLEQIQEQVSNRLTL